MPVGRVVDVPNVYTPFARVRDEYGTEYTVHGSELKDDAEPGDQFAYHVDLMQSKYGDTATLRSGTYGPEG